MNPLADQPLRWIKKRQGRFVTRTLHREDHPASLVGRGESAMPESSPDKPSR
jgi:hypothetical protein